MKIVADESVDGQIVDRLRADGYEVYYIAELDPGVDDDAVLLRSHETAAILVTADKDFGELVYRQRRLHSGIVLLRLAGLTPDEKAVLVAGVFDRHGVELSGRFSVVSERLLRMRNMAG